MLEGSLAEQAYELIKGDIITCGLAPGEQVAQPKLVQTYGIGATPIREALQRLAQEGFVQAMPRFGYVVTPITLSDVKEIFELRSVLESASVRLATERGSDEELRKLTEEAGFAYIHQDRTSYTEFLTRNAEFHRAICIIAGNQRLVDAISKVLGELTRVFHLGLDLRDSAQEMRDEHIELARALVERNVNEAEQCIQAQIVRSQERVVEAIMLNVRGGSSGQLGNVRLSISKP